MNSDDALKLWGAAQLYSQTKASGGLKERIIDLNTVTVTLIPASSYLCYIRITAYGFLESDKKQQRPNRYHKSIESDDFSFSKFLKEVLEFSSSSKAKRLLGKLETPLKKELVRQTVYSWD